MRVLSNLLGGANASAWVYRRALPTEIDDAVSLVLGSPAAPADANQVEDFKLFARQRGIDLSEMGVAGAGNQLMWAVLPIYSPGRTVLLLTPGHLPRGGDAAPLIEQACQVAAARGVHLAQVLAEPSAADMQKVYNLCGFRQIAELLYLQSAFRRTPAPPRLPEGYAWHPYSEQTHPIFCRAIVNTYSQSLDCPALCGLRDIEDIVAGHRASGEFSPANWSVLIRGPEPLGVALLTRVPRVEMAELVYLGLTPEARGQGLGDVMMRQALWSVSQMGLQRLTLAVDARNSPALKLYYRHGLGHVGSKSALLRDLRLKTQITPAPPG